MSDGTKIEWTDATLNVVNGCSVISPGCTNCYAMRSGGRNLPNHPATGLTKATKAGHVWTGDVRFNEKALLQPLRWKRPRKIFWNAHGDLFHENVPDEWIDRCFAVMALTPHHIHQVLTKRPERMREYVNAQTSGARSLREHIDDFVTVTDMQQRDSGFRRMIEVLSNVWLGVSVEDQQRAEERIPILLDTPAAVRWLSCEPLLGPVDVSGIIVDPSWVYEPLRGVRYNPMQHPHYGDDEEAIGKIEWVVAGGESGPGARPMHPDWARSLRDQCAAAGVPFLFKQWGSYAPVPQSCPVDESRGSPVAWPDGHIGDGRAAERGGCGQSLFLGTKGITGRLLDGVQHDGYPA